MTSTEKGRWSWRFASRTANLAITFLTTAGLIAGLLACDSSPTEPVDTPGPSAAVFVVDSCPASADDDTYRLRITDPAVIAEAERLIATGEQRIPLGQLRQGDGGFNAPWSWHVDPATVEFADATIEVCDGCASFIENDLDAWFNVGSFCPWSAVVLSREQ